LAKPATASAKTARTGTRCISEPQVTLWQNSPEIEPVLKRCFLPLAWMMVSSVLRVWQHHKVMSFSRWFSLGTILGACQVLVGNDAPGAADVYVSPRGKDIWSGRQIPV